jgi:hypothetical protein
METRRVAVFLPTHQTRKELAMIAFAPVFFPRVGCKYRPKKAPRSEAAMLITLARLGFVLSVCFIGGVLLGLFSQKSETPRVAEAALSLHQTQEAQEGSAVAADSASRRAAKRKTSSAAFKRAAKLSVYPQASRNDRLAWNSQ